jgi:uncharacterized protein (TIGR00156 family)
MKIIRYAVVALLLVFMFSSLAFATTEQRGSQRTPSEERSRAGNEARTTQQGQRSPDATPSRQQGQRPSDATPPRQQQRSPDATPPRQQGQRPSDVAPQRPPDRSSWQAVIPPWRRHLQQQARPSATAPPPWRGDWYGGFYNGEYFGKGEPVFTVAEVNNIIRDDGWAILLGKIDARVNVWNRSGNWYRFVEHDGRVINVQIDHSVFEGRNITRNELVEIRGEIIKDFHRMIDVKQIIDVQ